MWLRHSSISSGKTAARSFAVKLQETFLRYLQAADELARRRERKRGVKSGSDGTRTRDLRRDRPVLELAG
jgi:hypothetical protein